jgi:hypothetical protein
MEKGKPYKLPFSFTLRKLFSLLKTERDSPGGEICMRQDRYKIISPQVIRHCY